MGKEYDRSPVEFGHLEYIINDNPFTITRSYCEFLATPIRRTLCLSLLVHMHLIISV